MELDAEETREEHARGIDYARSRSVEQVGITGGIHQVGSMTIEIDYDSIWHDYSTDDVMKSQAK